MYEDFYTDITAVYAVKYLKKSKKLCFQFWVIFILSLKI